MGDRQILKLLVSQPNQLLLHVRHFVIHFIQAGLQVFRPNGSLKLGKVFRPLLLLECLDGQSELLVALLRQTHEDVHRLAAADHVPPLDPQPGERYVLLAAAPHQLQKLLQMVILLRDQLLLRGQFFIGLLRAIICQ